MILIYLIFSFCQTTILALPPDTYSSCNSPNPCHWGSNFSFSYFLWYDLALLNPGVYLIESIALTSSLMLNIAKCFLIDEYSCLDYWLHQPHFCYECPFESWIQHHVSWVPKYTPLLILISKENRRSNMVQFLDGLSPTPLLIIDKDFWGAWDQEISGDTYRSWTEIFYDLDLLLVAASIRELTVVLVSVWLIGRPFILMLI